MWKKCLFGLFLYCFGELFGGGLAAQEPVNKFLIRIRGGAISGTEEYRIEKAEHGFRLTSKTQLKQPSGPTEITQELRLTPDLNLVRYRLKGQSGGQPQTIEAWREGRQIAMRLTEGKQSRSQRSELRPRTLVLDNLLASHYQILLDRLAGKVEGNENWWLVVPQRLAAVQGRLAVGSEEAGTLHGQSVWVRKYTLALVGTRVEFWAETSTNQLMRVIIPEEKVELVREGFVLAPRALVEPKEALDFVESDLLFPSGRLQIPATLCLPVNRTGRVPAVVLVQGSGPYDRDESSGPNKPFRDLAHGLAGAGIATLRYDKRTFAFRDQIDPKTISVNEEVIEDAVAALQYLQKSEGVNPEEVFLLGHDLGGTLAPFIAERFPHLRGIILLAAGARPADELIFERTAYELRVAGQSNEEILRRLQELSRAFLRVRTREAPDTEMILFASARYWRDLIGRSLMGGLESLSLPVLVLQGSRDHQVSRGDFELIQRALADKPASQRETHWLPSLNHLFMRSEGESREAEKSGAGNVDIQVIQIIADWVKKQTAASPVEPAPKAPGAAGR